MGGSKKKSISQVEKAQSVSAKGSEKKGKRDISATKFAEFLREIPEQQIIKNLTEIKAITAYNAAKALNTNASIATALLRDLESKGLASKAGGSSGHYVYRLTTKS